MSTLSNEERETHLNMVANDRGTWHCYTDDPIMQQRLERLGITCAKQDKSGGKHYVIPANQVTIRRKRELTEEQRTNLAERMKRMKAQA